MGAIIRGRRERLAALTANEGDFLSELSQRMTDAEAPEHLPAICKSLDVPYGRVMEWLMAEKKRFDVYKRCLEVQAHRLVSETVPIADGADKDTVAAAKLQVDTRFRIAKHHAPEVYGEKDEGHAGVTVVINRGGVNDSVTVQGNTLAIPSEAAMQTE